MLNNNSLKITLALGLVAVATPCSAVNIVISGVGDNPSIISFLNDNFTNIDNIESGNFGTFSSTATTDALAANGGADLVIIGRTLSSGDYDAGVSDGYNTLTIPVVSFTSFVSRASGNRLGWHGDSVSQNLIDTAGDESLITSDGATFFGLGAGAANIFEGNQGGNFNALAQPGSDFGGAQILATIGGAVQSAFWATGSAPGDTAAAGVATFPGERLLFNLDNDAANGEAQGFTFNALTDDGEAALISSLAAVSDLQAVPEPSGALLAGLALLLPALRRRR